jgi:hypothetical protein
MAESSEIIPREAGDFSNEHEVKREESKRFLEVELALFAQLFDTLDELVHTSGNKGLISTQSNIAESWRLKNVMHLKGYGMKSQRQPWSQILRRTA